MTFPIAHAGHWFANLLYAAPVFVVVGALVVQRFRDPPEDVPAEADDQSD